jgi:hypothetical protein
MPLAFSLSLCRVGAGAVVVARDVTEQRLAQATKAEVEERLDPRDVTWRDHETDRPATSLA